jgi:hypothetical protein
VSATEGPVACGAACSGTYEAGTIVRLRAEADGSSRFVGWSGSACSSTASLCVFTVEGATTVTATFAKQGFRMNVSRAGADGEGSITASVAGIDCPTVCSFVYPAGTPVTLTATPAAGSVFGGWTTNDDCVPSGLTCTTTMDAAKFIAAIFRRGVVVTISINTGATPGNGAGTITSEPAGISCSTSGGTCSGMFFPGTTVVLNAAPAAGSSFRDWEGCDATNGARCEVVANPPAGAPLPPAGTPYDLGRTIVGHFTTP